MKTLKPDLKESFIGFVAGFEPYFAVLGTFITVTEEVGGSLDNLFGREAAWIAANFINVGDIDEESHSGIIEDFRMAFAPYTVGAMDAPRSAILRAMVKMSAGEYRSNISQIFNGLIEFDKLVESKNYQDKIPPMSHIYATNAMSVAIAACHSAGLKSSDIHGVLDYVDFLKSEINANLVSKLNIDLDKFRAIQPTSLADIINEKIGYIDTSKIIRDSLAAMNQTTQLIDLITLAGHESATVRRSLAQNPAIPADLMVRLAQDRDTTVRSGLALNSVLPIDVQRLLRNDEDSLVRKALASNNIISNEVLDVLVKDKDEEVRSMAIAGHPLTSRQKLIELSKSQDTDVRTAVARNVNTPDAALLYLSNDEEFSVKIALLSRPELTYKSLIILSNDADEQISGRAKNILDESAETIKGASQKDFKNEGYLYILMNPSMPGIIKIGKTIRQADDRANELSSHTGVPTPFVVVYEQHFKHLDSAEKRIHALLSEYRVSQNREFFEISSSRAIKLMMSLEE